MDWALFCKAVALSGWQPRNAGIADIPNQCCCSENLLFLRLALACLQAGDYPPDPTGLERRPSRVVGDTAVLVVVPSPYLQKKEFLFCSMAEDLFRIAWVQEALIGVYE